MFPTVVASVGEVSIKLSSPSGSFPPLPVPSLNKNSSILSEIESRRLLIFWLAKFKCCWILLFFASSVKYRMIDPATNFHSNCATVRNLVSEIEIVSPRPRDFTVSFLAYERGISKNRPPVPLSCTPPRLRISSQKGIASKI